MFADPSKNKRFHDYKNQPTEHTFIECIHDLDQPP